jgi:fructose-bisphosphate aldolase class II
VKPVQDNAKYRYTWLMRFCNPLVIHSYREHPHHVTFADKLFRPVAGERISIDYQMVDPVASGSSNVEHSINMKAMQ